MTEQYPWYCTHCDTPLARTYSNPQPTDKPVFCCDGCKTVYRILSKHNLDQYYSIKKNAPLLAAATPVTIKHNRYDYLESAEHLKKYAYGEHSRQMDFYVEGIHCVACLWLIERIGLLVPGVAQAQLDIGTSMLRVTLKEEGSFALVATTLQELGYTPHAIENNQQLADMTKRESHRQIIQMGTAGFCAGNIMLLFISIYSGVTGMLLSVFLWASFILMLPVVTYCAWPFYKSALNSLRVRQINIDVPVSLALLVGFTASTYQFFSGSTDVYYDSLAIFVFLLLSTRLFLKSLHQRFSGGAHYSEFLMPRFVNLFDAAQQAFVDTPVEKVNVGDRVRVDEASMIPVDGTVVEGEGYVDLHMLTGESQPVFVERHSMVYAGTFHQSGSIVVEAENVKDQTRLANIFRNIQHAQKPRIVALADRVAKWFLLAVICFGAGVMLYFYQTDFSEGLKRALALIIVACPCALALATPLAYTIGLKRCAALGALLKGPEVLERLPLVEHVYLDKTGTLTYGGFKVLQWQSVDPERSYFNEAYHLEEKSKHPIALAIRDYVAEQSVALTDLVVENYDETLGRGVSGIIKGDEYELRASETAESSSDNDTAVKTRISLFKNGTCCVKMVLGDRIRESAFRAVEKLHARVRQVTILTGDSEEVAKSVATQLDIKSYQSRLFPEDKQNIVEKDSHALMIGDGANDAAALASAFVSMAVQGSLEVSFRSADIYLVNPGLQTVPALMNVAGRTRSTVKRNLIISILYNAFGITFAAIGWINPLGAAIIMPLSSITVLLSSYFGIKAERI